MEVEQMQQRLGSLVMALFAEYERQITDEQAQLWMSVLSPYGEAALSALRDAVVEGGAFRPRLGEVVTRAQKNLCLVADPSDAWATTYAAVKAWADGGPRPVLEDPACAYALTVVGALRIRETPLTELGIVRSEFDRAIGAFNAKPVEIRRALAEEARQCFVQWTSRRRAAIPPPDMEREVDPEVMELVRRIAKSL